ncbi:MAG: diacylglycerol kinase family protein [Candidatus Caccosoma sp.]|nr:diacylglycerol kinase family protein [Candidatus Caccosoma sp.]
MNYILYNTKSNSGKYQDALVNYKNAFSLKDYKEIDVISFNDNYREFLYSLAKNDTVTIIGGDGTLNHFINAVDGIKLPCNFYFYPSGTGNDFFNDVKEKSENGRVLLNQLIKNLPYVLVNGKKYFFINGIGFGIDGYCCEEGDRLHALNKKDVNYTSIAIKGLLFPYKAPNAKITVDGVSKIYKRV